MTDIQKLKAMAEQQIGVSDVQVAPDVVLELIAELEKFDDGMRALAFSLGAGGYNAVTLTADQLVAKVSDGLEMFTTATGELLDKVTAERDQLKATVSDYEMGLEAAKEEIARLKGENEWLRNQIPSTEMVWCDCGDGYPVNSYGAGFMAANGDVCENCDAANGGVEPDLISQNEWLRRQLESIAGQHAPLEPIPDEDGWSRKLPGYDLVSLLRDAERYRWLRQDDVVQYQISTKCSEEKMDAAIDAAMSKESSHG